MSDAKTSLPSMLRVRDKRAIAEGIFLFDLVSPQGEALPPFTPGAHIDVRTPSRVKRSYSLCGDADELSSYKIAVKREPNGRGGSISLVDHVNVGDCLEVTSPANNFELNTKCKNFIFVAGGIGITPIMSMIRFASKQEALRWKLHYCTRNLARAAFADELRDLQESIGNGEVVFHESGEQSNRFDFWSLFERARRDYHIFCCGPAGLMGSVRDSTGHWPRGSVHFEAFGSNVSQRENRAFVVRLATGEKFEVPPDQSILDVLRRNGRAIPSSCESGTCGTCRTRLLSGRPDHRDMVLTERDRDTQIIPCVSRSDGDELVLDLN